MWEVSPWYRLATCSKGTPSRLKSFQWQPGAMSTVGRRGQCQRAWGEVSQPVIPSPCHRRHLAPAKKKTSTCATSTFAPRHKRLIPDINRDKQSDARLASSPLAAETLASRTSCLFFFSPSPPRGSSCLSRAWDISIDLMGLVLRSSIGCRGNVEGANYLRRRRGDQT